MIPLLEVDAFEAWVVLPFVGALIIGLVMGLFALIIIAMKWAWSDGQRGAVAFLGVLLVLLLWLTVGSLVFAVRDPSGFFENERVEGSARE